jgi:tetratricopeptide (TPR) repeat protein
MSGAYREALGAAQRFRAIPKRQIPLADLLIGERLLGVTHHVLGDQELARRHLESMLARYSAPADQSHRVRYQFDQRVAALSFLGQTLWIQGFADQAKRTIEAAVGEASSSGHAASRMYALYNGACPVALLCGDLPLADRYIDLLSDVAAINDNWQLWAECSRGIRLIAGGDPLEGTRVLRAGLSGMSPLAFQQRYASYLGALAVGELEIGDLDSAASAIEEALQQSYRNEDRWCVAELLRIRGDVALRGERGADAEALFEESLDWSVRQGALSWELRTATSLARLKQAQGRASEARARLRFVYDRFTEGFETADLRAARNLLKALA